MVRTGAPLEPDSPLPLWISVAMALASMVASLLAVAHFGLSGFPMVAQACLLNGLSEEGCAAGASRVGHLAAIAYLVVLSAGVGLGRLWPAKGGRSIAELPPSLVRLVLMVAFALLGAHLVALVAGPAFASRSDESEHYAILISVENLLWPFLLQLYVSQSNQQLRACLLSALLVVMALTPYRAVLLAVVVFGFAIPFVRALWSAARNVRSRVAIECCAGQGAILLVVAGFAVWGGYVGTLTRFPSLYVAEQAETAKARLSSAEPPSASSPAALPEPSAGPPAPIAQPDPSTAAPRAVTALPPAGLLPRLAQRLAFPLYQAAIAGQLATTVTLPSPWTELGRKFRLTSDPTREEFLFRRIYGGVTSDQTTSLYYGEAVAWFPGPPFVWMILGPLALVVAALAFARTGFASATLFGVGVWRSSFSGLVPILPAMIMQLAALASLAWLARRSDRWPRLGRVALAIARPGLAVVVGLLLIAQLWAITSTPARRTLVIANFSLSPHCTLVSPTWVTIRTDQALARRGMSVRSSLAWTAGDSLAVTLSLGPRANPALPDIASGIATLVECSGETPAAIVTPVSAQRFGAVINPLDVAAAVALLAALLGLLGISWRDVASHAQQQLKELPTTYGRLTSQVRLAVVAGLGLLFLVLAASSLIDPPAAMIACAALLSATALIVPQLGIALVLLCTPIRAVFDLSQDRMQVVLAAGLMAVAVRHLPLLGQFLRERRPLVLTLFAAFICMFVARTALETMQFGTDDPWGLLKETVFYPSVLMVALAAHSYADDRRFLCDLMAAVGIAITLTIGIDGIDLYFPMTGESWGLLRGYPSLRFSGLHVNPNATGKYLIFGSLLACCALWVARERLCAGLLSIAAVAVVTLAISATLSKSTTIAVLGALLAFMVHHAWLRRWRETGAIAAATLLVVSAMATWYVAFGPWTYRHTARTLVEMKRLSLEGKTLAAKEQSIAELVENELRLSQSYSMKMTDRSVNKPPNSEMYRKLAGSIVYTKRDCSWTCAGQRDLLWGTGLKIVGDHWLVGIGPHRWVAEYLARLQFPFDTPHNGLLELWGGYGLAGAALYLALLLQLLRLATASLPTNTSSPQFVFLVGTSLYVISMLLGELVDPAKFFTMNPHAIWLWTFVAAQARLVGAGRQPVLEPARIGPLQPVPER
jgi:hypothetical protein